MKRVLFYLSENPSDTAIPCSAAVAWIDLISGESTMSEFLMYLVWKTGSAGRSLDLIVSVCMFHVQDGQEPVSTGEKYSPDPYWVSEYPCFWESDQLRTILAGFANQVMRLLYTSLQVEPPRLALGDSDPDPRRVHHQCRFQIHRCVIGREDKQICP